MTPGGVCKTYAFGFLLAGVLLIAWNYRGRHRVGVLRAQLGSDEFASLLVAMLTTTLAFSALAFFPLMQHSTATTQAQLYDGSTSRTVPLEFEPPNLSPPGVPNSVGDVLQLSSFFFVFIPVAIVALPLLLKQSRYRGVVEAALATGFAALALAIGVDTAWFFLPSTGAMLSAAAFAQNRQAPSY
jgi:hypothetical protein